jgi:hypothetical protein
MAVSIKMTAICDTVTCSVLNVNRRFRGVDGASMSLERRSVYTRLHDAMLQKVVIVTAKETVLQSVKQQHDSRLKNICISV